jgi:hypothetical protein
MTALANETAGSEMETRWDGRHWGRILSICSNYLLFLLPIVELEATDINVGVDVGRLGRETAGIVMVGWMLPPSRVWRRW